MGYQLLCLDLDGTLLDAKKQLSPEDSAAVRQAWEAGTQICIASGRGAGSADGYLEKMGVTGSVTALNGGQVVCHGTEIYRAEMTPKTVGAVLQIVKEMGLTGYFNDGEKTLAVNEDEASIRRRLGNDPMLLKTYQVETEESLWEKVAGGRQKIVKISIREDDPERLEEIRKRVEAKAAAGVAKSDVNYLDIFPSGQSKWTGIERLLRHLDIPAGDCVCFGDNENDQEMLVHAGLGIAMGNASPELKAAADRITKPAGACGVAYGIRTWVL